MDDQEIANRIIRKMVRMRVVGSHNKQIDTLVNLCLPTHDRGRGRRLFEELVADPEAPVERYGGGHRETVRLTSIDEAIEYLKAHGGDVPFGFE